jgi:hypothetical protein
MPESLDVVAWLGAGSAEHWFSAGNAELAALDRAAESVRLPEDELARHGSLYRSGLDAMATWLRTSAGEAAEPPIAAEARDRRKIETALLAWTLLRHDALAFGHVRLATSASATPAALGGRIGQVFIDPHPEAIASLLGMVAQTRRGLVAIGALTEDSASAEFLTATERLLELALEGAVRALSPSSAYADLAPDLAQIPDRLAALESRAGPAAEPVVIDVHADLSSGKVLEEGTGAIDELFVLVRDPTSHRKLVAIGVSIPHYEFTTQAEARWSDSAWQVRVRSGRAPDRNSLRVADLVPP